MVREAPNSNRRSSRSSKLWLGVGGLLLSLFLAAVFTLGSLQIPFEPGRWDEVLVLFALSTFIVALFVVFLFVFLRTLLRTWAERRAGQMGARFRTKMVAGAMAISFLPVVFMFFISYALLNRTLNRWFPRPLEVATEESQKLLNDLGRNEHAHLKGLAHRAHILWSSHTARNTVRDHSAARKDVFAAVAPGADALWALDGQGNVLWSENRITGFAHPPFYLRTLPSGAELWRSGPLILLAGRHASGDTSLVVARELPTSFLYRYSEIERQTASYDESKQQLRAIKNQMLLVLGLFTILLLFSSTWAALFLSKQVTVPIQALAEATREVSSGNFSFRVEAQARDELGILVQSFNAMTEQLGESRAKIDEFTASLQQALEELERRRKLMETILENIPTAVLFLDESGNLRQVNSAAKQLFGDAAQDGRTLEQAIGADAAHSVALLMRKALRMGKASKELEVTLGGRLVHATVTVSALGSRRENPGFVVVLEDLTELLRAQKAAAWQEVAQRIAHEIKNPLTPIQLSAQRLTRYLEKSAAAGHPVRREIEGLVSECSELILREVNALKTLVNEFSQFARFPTVKPEPADVNDIVRGALDVFHGRLEGVQMHIALMPELPLVRADRELLRRVVVNLLDNAAEAMEGAKVKELHVSTRFDPDGEMVEISVADTGHGISPQDKDKLFLPHFSTRERGTGLGLAIASRIVAEHEGTIRVEDNQPTGARFVIRLPLAEAPAPAMERQN
jgi:PAS domain S-box-containing protein